MTLRSFIKESALPIAGLALLAIGLLADVLLMPGDFVASKEFADTSFYFARLRQFAYAEMAGGNIPLWNPHIFAGQPLLGTFQPALLYPLNLPYFVLPLAKAINFDFALHTFLTGLFTFAWVRSRGVKNLGAFFAGALAMLAGATAFRVMAGQLSLVASNAWAPLVLLAVERTLARPQARWIAIGVGAASCQVLAGYPFSALATAFLAAATIALRLWRSAEPLKAVAALGAIGGAPLFLTAAQLWTGAATLSESTRAGGVASAFAKTHSLPIENLFTTLLPEIWGGLLHEAYWGSSWFWDSSIFLGAPAIALALVGARLGSKEQRQHAGVMLLVLVILALGRHTPVFAFCFEWIPGFNLFRAPSKFFYLATMFIALLAGIGIDKAGQDPASLRRGIKFLGILAAISVVLALWIPTQTGEGQFWSAVVQWVGGSWIYTPKFAVQTGDGMRPALLLLAGISGACAVLFSQAKRSWAVPAALVIAIAELFYVARIHRGEFSLGDLARPELEAVYKAHPGDHRYYPLRMASPSQGARLEEGRRPLDHSTEWFVRGVARGQVDLILSNHSVSAGTYSVWGYDPMQLGRTATFFTALAKGGPGFATQGVLVTPIDPHPLMSLLRTRYVIDKEVIEDPSALPRFLFLNEYKELEPEAVMRTLFEPDFDPRKTLLLEETPVPLPAPNGREGRVTLLEESTDQLRIRVEAPDDTLLLITDAYAEGWRVHGLGPEAKILPANGMLRALAIPAGTYELELEYAPLAYRVGLWVSLVSSLAYLGFVVWIARSKSNANDGVQ